MNVEIKLARGSIPQIRKNVPPDVWEKILDRMEEVFAEHEPDIAYGETIKPLKFMAVPEFRFRFMGWRVGYCVEIGWLKKRVVIYRCDERDKFYSYVRRLGRRK